MNKRINAITPILPQELDGNLRLRWATPADAEAIAAFNMRIHSDDPPQLEDWLGSWTRDLMLGHHPTTTAADVTLVEEIDSGAPVSTLLLIPQVWSYDGLPLGVGRIELVGTDEAYRRRGLVRWQMAAIHARSERLGHHLQAITGIPWYYRQFGYEMAIDLGGGRDFFWIRAGNDVAVDEELFQMRPATAADIPALQTLYATHCAGSLLSQIRTPDIWRWEMEESSRDSEDTLHAFMIFTASGEAAAYVEYRHWGASFVVRELGVTPGMSWREVALFLTRELKRKAANLADTGKKPVTGIRFVLAENHPLYTALGDQLERPRRPYAWYIRIPDLVHTVRYLAPVLEARLANGVLAGYSGSLRLNFYRDTLRLDFADGRLTEVGSYQPNDVEDADALFPELTFLQLLLGYRSLEQLSAAYPDCYAERAGTRILLDVLFPAQPSRINALG